MSFLKRSIAYANLLKAHILSSGTLYVGYAAVDIELVRAEECISP